MSKKTYICSTCGSDEILWDAYAVWNPDTQDMELHSTFPDVVCENCGGSSSYEEVIIENSKD